MSVLQTKITNEAYLFFLSLLYFSLLLFLDYRFLTELYAYSGFLNHFSVDKLVVALPLFIVFFLFIDKSLGETSRFYLYIIIFFVLIPMLVNFVVTSNYYYLYVCSLSCLIVFLLVKFVRLRSYKIGAISTLSIIRLLSVLVVLFVAFIIVMGGLNFFNLDVSRVYEYRGAASAIFPSWFGYISSAINKVFIPIIIVLAFIHKKNRYVLFAIVMSICMFGLLSHKFILLVPFITLFIYVFFQKNINKYMLITLCFILFLSILDFYFKVIYSFPISGWFASIFARRGLMLPALITDFHIDFFSHNDFYYWCRSKVTFGLLSCSYEVSAPNIIGLHYFNNIETSANIGWIGSGYANMGIWGSIIYSIFIGLVICLLESFSKKIGTRFVVSTSFIIILTALVSTDAITVLLTHGLVYLIVIYTFIPRIIVRKNRSND